MSETGRTGAQAPRGARPRSGRSAQEAGDAAAESDALRFTAYEMSSGGRSDDAVQLLAQAIALAERAGDDRAVGVCAAQLAFEVGESKRGLDAASRWLDLARAKARAASGGIRLLRAARTCFTDAELASLLPDGAEREYALWGAVADTTREVYGPGAHVCPALSNRGQAAWRRLDPAACLEATRASIACEEEVNGEHSDPARRALHERRAGARRARPARRGPGRPPATRPRSAAP